MTDRHEFAGAGWLQALCELVERTIAESGVDLSGVTYTFGEEFTNVPERLRLDGSTSTGWHVAVRDGVVSARPELPPADADRITVVDWASVEHLARHVFGIDAEADAAVGKEAAELTTSGKLQRVERTPEPEVLQQALMRHRPHHIHNLAAAFTAP